MFMKPLFSAIIKTSLVAVISAITVFSTSAFAAQFNPSRISIPDLATMVNNLATNMTGLMQFVTALSYVLGMFFIIEGVLKLKKYGESRTQGMVQEQFSLRAAMIYMGVGGGLLYLPSSVQVGLTTFWDNPTPYAYVTSSQDPWAQLIQSIFIILQLIGTIAFIRGLVILSHVGGQGGQPGTFGRAMAHIVGGIFLINIYQFIQTVGNTFGIRYF